MGGYVLLFVGIFVGVMVSFSKIDESQLDAMNSKCAVNGGFEKAVVDFVRADVHCKDGAKFRLKD